MSPRFLRSAGLFALALGLFLPAPSARADLVYWIASTTSDWTNSGNWSTNRPPNADDAGIIITYNGTAVVTTSVVASTNGQIYISSFSGTGTLNINPGGALSTTNAVTIVGQGGTGTVNMNGGTWDVKDLDLGYSGGEGRVFLNSGTLTTTSAHVGYLNTGSATVSGGIWNSNLLRVGNNGAGTLTMTGGTINTTFGQIGFQTQGMATVSAGTWNNATSLEVGVNFGSGTLTLTNSAVITVASGTGTVTLGSTSNSQNNKLQIGNNTNFTGSLQAATVKGGSGTSVVIFGQTNAYVFAPNLTGSLSVQQNGSGTTTLNGANTYAGGTTVMAGTLLVNGAAGAGTGAVGVKIGGTLGGTGSVTGALTVEGGGKLAPGSSTFTANGGISLLDNAKIAFRLGTTSDLVTVNGALSLGKNVTLDLSAGVGFDVGQYTLINFTGGLTDNSAAFSGWTITGLPNNGAAIFSVSGSALMLNVLAVPEPVSGTSFALGALICLVNLRNRRFLRVAKPWK